MIQFFSQKNKKSFSGSGLNSSKPASKQEPENDKLKTLQKSLNFLDRISDDPKADKQIISNRIKEITYMINEQKLALESQRQKESQKQLQNLYRNQKK